MTINVAHRLAPNATIVVMPLQKRIKQAAVSHASQKPVTQSPVQKKPSPVKKPSTTLATDTEKIVQAAVKKEIPKSQPATQKPTPKKPLAKPESKVVKAAPKPVVPPKVAQQPKKIPVVQPEPSIKQELPALAYAEQQATLSNESVIYVGREDAQLLKIHDEIVQELHKHWQSPVGMTSDCSCLVNVCVSAKGTISDVLIEKPSGVLVYDIAARSAVLAMNMPKWVWGKKISIAFNQ